MDLMKKNRLIQRHVGAAVDGLWGHQTADFVLAKMGIEMPKPDDHLSPSTGFNRWIVEVLKHEGGYVNHPKDPGGATNKGVTQAVYTAWRREQGLNPESVKYIEKAEVFAIYRRNYWDRVEGDNLPAGVDYAVFDFAVNSGVGRAARYLQSLVGVKQDGVIGPATIDAVKLLAPGRLIDDLCNKRLRFMRGLKIWRVFGKGWARRVEGVRKKAKAAAK